MVRSNTTPPGPARRVFLFLQGPSSPIFSKIADRLEHLGHHCLRINLNVGDRIFWRRKGGTSYRGAQAQWPDFIRDFMRRHLVTNLVLLGEERPYHQVAVKAAHSAGIEVTVIEMGYLRPDWLTLERNGMSSNSHFPSDPERIMAAALDLPEPDWVRRYSQTFVAEAGYDLLYNLPNVFLWFLYPGYHRHAIFHPLAEYAGWVLRLANSSRRERRAKAIVEHLTGQTTPFFVFPLQLQTDFQLRAHSPYNDQREAIIEVFSSFAHHGPADSHLAVKSHPLDNGLIGWEAFVRDASRTYGISDRVHFLDGGDLAMLLSKSAGVVTINSTVGLHALQSGKPVKVLGTAIFDIEGLTDNQPLDGFWQASAVPDQTLCSAFFRLLAATLQVRGNFYSKDGTDAGADAIALRLHARTTNLPGAFEDIPPRKKPKKRPPLQT